MLVLAYMGTKTKSESQVKDEEDVRVRASGGNVFADLGLPNADERLAKAELADEICVLIKSANLAQVQAARRLGVD